jgi:hypothetical protein
VMLEVRQNIFEFPFKRSPRDMKDCCSARQLGMALLVLLED